MRAHSAQVKTFDCQVYPSHLRHGVPAWSRFTPTDEVDLCGHATLASSHALWEAGHADESQPIHFETLSGTLIASRADDDGSIQLDFPSEAATAVILQDADSSPAEEATMRLLRDGLGLHAPGQILSVTRNRMDILAEVTPDAFKQQELDFGILGKLANCRVLSVTTVGCRHVPSRVGAFHACTVTVRVINLMSEELTCAVCLLNWP